MGKRISVPVRWEWIDGGQLTKDRWELVIDGRDGVGMWVVAWVVQLRGGSWTHQSHIKAYKPDPFETAEAAMAAAEKALGVEEE